MLVDSIFSPRQIGYYISKAQQYARIAIICYKREKTNLWYYGIAFPHLMRCNWILKSKVERYFNQ